MTAGPYPHSLEIEDSVVKGETPGLPRFLVPYEGHGSGQRLFRPRFVVYIWCAVEAFLLPGTLNYAIWGFSAILAINMLTGFIAIRRKI